MTHRTLPAIALVLGLALSACGQDDATPKADTASDSPSPAADTTSAAPKPKPKPSPSPTPVDAPSAPAPTVDPITVSLKGLPTGSAPTVDYLRHGSGGWELVRAGGSTMPLARALVRTSTLRRTIAGLRKARAALTRRPRRIARWK